MSPRSTLQALLAALFDSNELRTLCSTDLYLGDLSSHLPAQGASDADIHSGVIDGLVARDRLGPGFFRTLRCLRPGQAPAIAHAERVCAARKVLVLFGGGGDVAPDRAREDARLAARLVRGLEQRGHRPLLPWPTPPRAPLSIVLDRGLEDCDALVVLLSAASSGAPATALSLERMAERGWPAVLAVATDNTMPPPSLVALLQRASVHPCTYAQACASLIEIVEQRVRPLLGEALRHRREGESHDPWPPPRGGGASGSPPSPVERGSLGALGLPGETIFQELLVQPLRVSGHRGRRTVELDRRGVEQLVLTTQAKTALWTERLGSPSDLQAGEAWDAWFEARLVRGEQPPPPAVPCPPLRWGGAGVLARVRWRGDDWVPLLFRDIPPVGWNLPLGASGRSDDMSDPASWGRRELLEELIVLAGSPSHQKPIALRPLLLPGRTPQRALGDAIQACLPALTLRARHDQLPVVPCGASPLAQHAWLGQAVPCDSLPASSDLLVRSDDEARWSRNLLVAPVPLELGIDVVELLGFTLDDEDSILDGEVLERSDGSLELVRMPVAMMRVSAILRLFGPQAPALEPTRELPRSKRCAGLRPEDLHVFPWDVRRRRSLALGSRIGELDIDPRERVRHRSWHDRLGGHFLDAAGRPSSQHPSTLFVGATARLLAIWAHQER